MENNRQAEHKETKTREDVEALKRSWFRDPCWDIYDTEGFEDFRDELKDYQAKCEAQWEKASQEKTEAEKKKAEELGLQGLYRMIKEMETLQERHRLAIEYLADGNTKRAYDALHGREE